MVSLGPDATSPTPFPGGGGGYFNDGSVPGAMLDGGGTVRIALPTDCGEVRKLRNLSGGAAWRDNDDGTITAISNSTDVLVFTLPSGVTPTIVAGGSEVDLTTTSTTDAIELLVEGVGPNSYVRIGSAASSGFSLFALRTPASVTPPSLSSSSSGASTSSAPSVVDAAVSVAVGQAAGISGASSVLIRDGQPVPVTTTITAGSGSRGAAVIEAAGMRITLDGGLGATESAGILVAPDGEIVCEVCADLTDDSVIEAWIYSTPRLAAAVRVEVDTTSGECPLLRIPVGSPLDGGDGIEAGAHTLQLRMYTDEGFEVLATGITVGGPVPASVPAGEGPVRSSAALLVLALLSTVAFFRGLRGRPAVHVR